MAQTKLMPFHEQEQQLFTAADNLLLSLADFLQILSLRAHPLVVLTDPY